MIKVTFTSRGMRIGDTEVDGDADYYDDYYDDAIEEEDPYEVIADVEELLASNFRKPLLAVELVPESCWCSNVRDHATPDQWDTLRRATYKRYSNLCAICKGRGSKWPVECHEVWEYSVQENCNLQKLRYLIALCPSCHEVKHIGRAQAMGNELRAMRHLSRVNNWNRAKTERYLRCIMLLWNARSDLKWDLDLSWVSNRFGFSLKEQQ